MVAYLRKLKIEPIVSESKYKLKFTRQGLHEFSNEIEDNVSCCMRILKLGEGRGNSSGQAEKVCIQFQKLSGNQLTFVKQFLEYRTDQNCLGFADDSREILDKTGASSDSPILQSKEAPLKMLEDELEREGVDYL